MRVVTLLALVIGLALIGCKGDEPAKAEAPNAGAEKAGEAKAPEAKTDEAKAPEAKADEAKAEAKTVAIEVEVPAEGKKFEPPIQKVEVPAGAWFCDMGTVHYARMDKGDGKCPICGMNLKEKPAAEAGSETR